MAIKFSSVSSSVIEKEGKSGQRFEKFGKNEKAGTTLVISMFLKVGDIDPKHPMKDQPAMLDVVSYYDKVNKKSFRLDKSVSPAFKAALESIKTIQKSVYSTFPLLQYIVDSKTGKPVKPYGEIKIAEFKDSNLKKIRKIEEAERMDDEDFSLSNIDMTVATEGKSFNGIDYLEFTFSASKKHRIEAIPEEDLKKLKKEAKDWFENVATKRGGDELSEMEIEELVGNVLTSTDSEEETEEPEIEEKPAPKPAKKKEKEEEAKPSKSKQADPWDED